MSSLPEQAGELAPVSESSSQQTPTAYAHVALDPQGRPVIAGTRMRVIWLAADYRHGVDPLAIQKLYPQLTQGQVFGALAYYADHQAAVDAELAQESQEFAAARASAPQADWARDLAARRASR